MKGTKATLRNRTADLTLARARRRSRCRRNLAIGSASEYQGRACAQMVLDRLEYTALPGGQCHGLLRDL